MSGRLVISKHKSYHVWNQDNVEKVLRDERIHKEKQEAEAKREKDSLMEKNREVLLASKPPANDTPSENEEKGAPRELFNIFGDLQEAKAEEAERKVKKMEEERKQLLLLRQNGAAPWALGDGSREKAQQKAWYEAPGDKALQEKPIVVMERVVSGNEAISARDRDTKWKRKLDPMERYVYDNSYPESKEMNEVKVGSPRSHKRSRVLQETEMGNEAHEERVRRKDKKQKKSKHSKSSREKRESHEEDRSAKLMNELRKRRLERERLEKKKSSVLLANVDIYGPSR